MQRLFNNVVKLKEASTATKIIQQMKDLFQQQTQPSEYAYSVAELIDYKKYQSLTKENKNRLKTAIARELHVKSYAHKSSYTIEEHYGYYPEDQRISYISVNGMSVSFLMNEDEHEGYTACEFNFPMGLFDKTILEPTIKEVCERFGYHDILVDRYDHTVSPT